ncbi:melanoregulin-like [Synchiropus splendidus]|uniref:melanoregulin-like n=1 Tax=Synchiropus splendidus TaxID=270530 RepID=UPI00237E3CAA|nr:melanoregulin-like [Synchiropus splendidus]
MGAKYTTCCFHFLLNQNGAGKRVFSQMQTSKPAGQPCDPCSDTDPEEDRPVGPNLRKTENPWSSNHTCSYSPIKRGSDKELQAFISMRDKTDKATEEWEKLNYDIYTLRYTRREVRSRWKKILLQLGYQCEIDALLSVNQRSRISRDVEQLKRTTDLLTQLLDHSSLFPSGTEDQTKYLYVMDRLVSLDSAEDFVRLAREKYPKQ